MEAAPSDMEWQVPDQRQGANSYLLRCFPPGMGSNMQWDTNRRPVVRTGKDMAHQLPGVASSFSGSPDIPEGQVRDLCATAVGQHHRSGLHQQPGWDSVPTTDQSGKVSVAIGLAERYLIDSPTHTKCVQSGSRYRVQDDEGSDRLETQSCSFQQDKPNIWAPGSGPVCIQADLPTSSLFQLETRPISRGNGCLSTGLGTPERVCQSFLVPYRESSESSDDPESPGDPGSSHMERPAMVPSSPEHALGVSPEDTSTPQPDSESSGTGSQG